MNWFLCLLFLWNAHPAQALDRLELVEGDKKIIQARGSAWVEDGAIIRLESTGSAWQAHALRPGVSEIRIGLARYSVLVFSRLQDSTFRILQPVIGTTLQLRLERTPRGIAIKGHLQRWEDWETLASQCEENDCHFEMRASINSTLQKKVRQELTKKLQQFSMFPYRIEFTDRVQVHLPPALPQLEKIRLFLSRYGIQVIKDATSLEMQPLVKVQITVAEVKRSEFLKYGIQWPAEYAAQIIPSVANAGINLSASLQALEKNGFGKVLASPNLLCRSGKDAEFLAGGEFPIKIINFKLQDVIWKKYGILLRVKPLADFSGRMSISIETEISSIDPAMSVDGIPGLFTNRVQSHFDLSEPKTIALSGLLKKQTGESQDGLPGLGRIPVLGALFSSRDYREDRTELVIFVRPEIVGSEDFE